MKQDINAAIGKGARLNVTGTAPKLMFKNREAFAAYFGPIVAIVDHMSESFDGYRYRLTAGLTGSYFNFDNDTFYVDSPHLAEIARGEGFKVVRIDSISVRA